MVNAFQAKTYIQNLPQQINQQEIKQAINEVKTSFSSGIIFGKIKKESNLRVRSDFNHFVNNLLCYYLDLISGYGDVLFSLLGFGIWQKWLPYFNIVNRLFTLLPIVGLILILSIPILPLLIIFAPLGLLFMGIVILLIGFVLFSTLGMFVSSKKFSSSQIISKLDSYNLKQPAQNIDGSWDRIKLAKMLSIAVGIQIWKFYKYGLFHVPKQYTTPSSSSSPMSQQQQQNTKMNTQYEKLFDRIPSSIVCRSFMFEMTDTIRDVLIAAHHPNYRKMSSQRSVHDELYNLTHQQ